MRGPAQERLIEAFAFECARLHMKIDDHFPEIAEPLLNIVFPHLIRPISSMSVAEIEPDTTAIPPSGYVIAKNTTLHAKPVDVGDCKFTTTWLVTIWPVEVASAGLREPRKLVKDAKQAIVIRLKTLNGLGLDQMGWDTLRFGIIGPRRLAYHSLLEDGFRISSVFQGLTGHFLIQCTCERKLLLNTLILHQKTRTVPDDVTIPSM